MSQHIFESARCIFQRSTGDKQCRPAQSSLFLLAIVAVVLCDDELIYVARTRNGFVPASRRRVFEKLRPLVTPKCPFVNLPETRKARWGEALTAEKMKKCVWVRPEVVAQIGFLEWTEGDRLRHSKFAGLRDDKASREVVKEDPTG
jgi:ATP-dependent DNA ligase